MCYSFWQGSDTKAWSVHSAKIAFYSHLFGVVQSNNEETGNVFIPFLVSLDEFQSYKPRNLNEFFWSNIEKKARGTPSFFFNFWPKKFYLNFLVFTI